MGRLASPSPPGARALPDGAPDSRSPFQAYMEDHLKNKNRLEKEWEALCAYQAEPNSSLVAQREENVPKNRCPAVLTCTYRPGLWPGGRPAALGMGCTRPRDLPLRSRGCSALPSCPSALSASKRPLTLFFFILLRCS